MSTLQPYLSPDLVQRLAAIDVGSNSIRLVVAETQRGGKYRIVDDEREATRLGRALVRSGRLDDEAVEQSIDALRRFKHITDGFNCERVRAIATCAVREAENGREFCQRIRSDVGLDVEIISAKKEAILAFLSVRRRFDLAGASVLMADIGGGSTEIVLSSGELIEAIYPTNLGAVRICEKFGGGQAMVGDDYHRMIRWINRSLRKATNKPSSPPHQLVGSGGTFTNLAGMIMARNNQSGLPISGYRISRAELRHLLDRIRKMSTKDRRGVPGLNPNRADIIVPGLAVVDRIMARFRINQIQVHTQGVRDGLLLSMIQRISGDKAGPPDTQLAIDRFAAACGTEMAHGRHVAFLAGQIYSQLADHLGLPPEDQHLLETAARLQDVGYLINYEQHHKHSYHLIRNSQIDGFEPTELELIANVARYHRGAEPKKKHRNFRRLSAEDRARVCRLASILRIAGGLDRSHSQSVRGVTVNSVNGSVEILVAADSFPEVDLWGARRRAGLFEKEFEKELSITWQEALAQSSPSTAGT